MNYMMIAVRNASDSESEVTLFHAYRFMNEALCIYNMKGDLIQNDYTFLKSGVSGLTYEELLYETANRPTNIDRIVIEGIRAMDSFICDLSISQTDAEATEVIKRYGMHRSAKTDPLLWDIPVKARLDGYTKIKLTVPPNAELAVKVCLTNEKVAS